MNSALPLNQVDMSLTPRSELDFERGLRRFFPKSVELIDGMLLEPG